jgi:hypothetical protein
MRYTLEQPPDVDNLAADLYVGYDRLSLVWY